MPPSGRTVLAIRLGSPGNRVVLRDDEICEVVRDRRVGRIGVKHRDPRSVKTGLRQSGSGGFDAGFVRFDGDDFEVRVLSQLVSEFACLQS